MDSNDDGDFNRNRILGKFVGDLNDNLPGVLELLTGRKPLLCAVIAVDEVETAIDVTTLKALNADSKDVNEFPDQLKALVEAFFKKCVVIKVDKPVSNKSLDN